MAVGALLNLLLCYVFLVCGVLVIIFNRRLTRHSARSAERWSGSVVGKRDLIFRSIIAIFVGVIWIIYGIVCLRQQ